MTDVYREAADILHIIRPEAKRRLWPLMYGRPASALSTPTVPCTTCGTPTEMTGTKKCNRCWEVETRLEEYLIHPNARARTQLLIARLEAT